MVAVLTDDNGEPVALQLGYVDARGAKSTIEPPRKLWPIVEDWSERGLLPAFGPPQATRRESSSDGRRSRSGRGAAQGGNGGSGQALPRGGRGAVDRGARGCPVAALPRPSDLRLHLGRQPRQGRAARARRGDRQGRGSAGFEADRGITRGADRLLLAGRGVRSPRPRQGEDANSIWQSADNGRKALADLIAGAGASGTEPRWAHRAAGPDRRRHHPRSRAPPRLEDARRLQGRAQATDPGRGQCAPRQARWRRSSPPDLGDPEPWEEPVELGETLDELVEARPVPRR